MCINIIFSSFNWLYDVLGIIVLAFLFQKPKLPLLGSWCRDQVKREWKVLSSLKSHHEQSPPSWTEKVYGQEVIIEVKRWQACTRNTAGLWSLYEPGDWRVCGDGNQWATEQHRDGGHPRKQHHHVRSLGKGLTSVQQCVHIPPQRPVWLWYRIRSCTFSYETFC